MSDGGSGMARASVGRWIGEAAGGRIKRMAPVMRRFSLRRPIDAFTRLMLIALPVLILLVEHGGSAPYHLTALVAIAVMLLRRPPMPRPLAAEERLACMGFGAFTVTILISLVDTGFAKSAVQDLDVLLRPLWAIPILVLFVRTRPTEGWMWAGVSLGAIAAGLHAVYEVSSGINRAEGATSAITFGNTALLMGVTAVLGVPSLRRHGRWLPLVAGAALLCGALASFLSGSRGGWIAIPVLALMLLRHYWTPGSRRIAVAGATILLASATVAVLVPETGVQRRIDEAVSEFSGYLEDPAAYAETSIGERLDLWRASWAAFLQQPLLGGGIGHSFQAFLREGIAVGEYHPGLHVQTMPHNVLLDVLALRGLVGLAGLVALWLPLAVIFVRAARESDMRLRGPGMAGLMLLVAYAVFGLTDSVMDYGPPLAFFCFYAALLVHLVAQARVEGTPAAGRGTTE